MQRERRSFDRHWMFYRGDIPTQYAIKAGCTGGLTEINKKNDGEWTQIAYNDKEVNIQLDEHRWSKVSIPHDWVVAGTFDRDEWDAQGYLKTGIGCYRKVFSIPAEDEGKVITLTFDGVSRNATIWVNGHLLGNHFSGYSSFTVDLSDYLRYGDEGDNVIFIKVDATDYEGWWYEGAGIYRHIWLTKTDRLHVAQWGTYVTTPVVSDEEATVSIETTVCNEYAAPRTATLVTSLYDGETLVCEDELEFEIAAMDTTVLQQYITVPQPKRWDLDAPNLYRATSVLTVDGAVVDNTDTTFGIRTIAFTQEGFFLNGRHVVIKGTCNHQDLAGVGVALPDSLQEYKIQRLLDMGSNAYRSSHHPASPELLDACDRLGMLVMDENRKLDSSKRGVEDLKSLLYRDRNHPSIIMWCVDNEEVILGTKIAKRIETHLRDMIHKIDPTRPTTVAMNHGWNENGYEECVDIMGYNYGQRGDQYLKDMEENPSRMVICTESSSSTTTRGIYAEDPMRGYCSSYETNLAVWCCTHEKSWQDLKANPRLTGIFVWTGFDYRGEPTPYAWPCINSHFGIMDICGIPKDAYYYYQSVWKDEPIVHFFPHWDLKTPGETVTVRLVGNCERVELILNGTSLGERDMVPDGHLDWEVCYEIGTLRAVGKRDGVEVCDYAATTSGAPAQLALYPHRETLTADGCDATVIRAAVLDANGNVIPYADTDITFEASDELRILGVGNGDPSSHEADQMAPQHNYRGKPTEYRPQQQAHRRAFNGQCVVIVQSREGATGTAWVTASANGVECARVALNLQEIEGK